MQDASRITKTTLSRAYESPRFNEALAETLHPGGLELTARMARIAGITGNLLVLDIASGRGTTACFLSQTYGCRVIGIDLSPLSMSLARRKTATQRVQLLTDFIVADGERLPFDDAAFDSIVSECSFSLMPDKRIGAQEIARVLKPGGRLVLTDVVLKFPLSNGLKEDLTFDCCFSGAETREGYLKLFADTGLKLDFFEDHSKALKKATYQVITGYGSLSAFWEQFGSSSDSCCLASGENPDSRKLWMRMFREGKPGYGLFRLVKS